MKKAFLAALVIPIGVAIAFIYLYVSASGQISSKNDQISTYSQQISGYSQQTQNLQSQLSSANSQVANLQGQLTSTNSQVSSLQGQLSSANSQLSTLQGQLNTTLDTQIPEYYQFSDQYPYYWTINIPLKTYLYYKNQPRPTGLTKYNLMINDPNENDLMNALVGQIRQAALNNNLKQSDIINLVAAFTQSLVHTNNDVTTPYDDYPNYPVETLFQQGGDSEDNSILAADILTRLNFNLVFFVFNQPQHVALGLDFASTPGSTSWEYQSKQYVYLETTGQKWKLGQCPPVYTTKQPMILPLTQ